MVCVCFVVAVVVVVAVVESVCFTLKTVPYIWRMNLFIPTIGSNAVTSQKIKCGQLENIVRYFTEKYAREFQILV